MKLCVAQTKPFKGDIEKNIAVHKELINLAITNGAEMIIFPELSITGYEPELAATLATDHDDERFGIFQDISNQNNITIGFGYPAKNDPGISISMAIFEPGKTAKTYSKKYLHSSEEPFFTSGVHFTGLIGPQENIAPAICYELSVPQHAEEAFQKGASIYIASVVEDTEGVERAIKKLSAIASRYSMIVLMANCTGPTGAYACGGKSSAWNNKGELRGQLDAHQEGILIYDTETQNTVSTILREELVK
ncbi:MAG TPA: carbon-nitrogen hydrolase family protein [Chitinophagaceae bacterium]|jgi:predicted amidohydrolase|nr:carbon-nitrogen hydrolase family protein [Chitinophagaceae bacterium]